MSLYTALMAANGATITVTPVWSQTGVWIRSGGFTISSAMTVHNFIVSSGSSCFVFNQGKAQGGVVEFSGNMRVQSGGYASGVNYYCLHSQHAMIVDGGSADNVNLNASGLPQARNILTVQSGGVVSGLSVMYYNAGSRPTITVQSGGSIRNATFSGADIFISNGGYASTVTQLAYPCVVSMFAGGYLENLTLPAEGSQGVITWAGGTINGLTAAAFTSSAGVSNTVLNAAVSSGIWNLYGSGVYASKWRQVDGTLIINSGRSAYDVHASNALTSMNSGAYVSGLEVVRMKTGGGNATWRGAAVSDFIVSITVAGGSYNVAPIGCTMHNGVIMDGVRFLVQSGTTITGLLVSNTSETAGSTIVSAYNATAAGILINDLTLVGDQTKIICTLASNCGVSNAVLSGGSLLLQGSTFADGLYISEGAKVDIKGTGSANHVYIYVGGSLVVNSNGTAYIYGSTGGTVTSNTGAYIEYVTP